MIIGALGVLNDMTVTQASAVWEIHAAQPLRGVVDVYRSGMRVGRDHIASTVYTLVLAYTGAALPLLILFVITGRGVTTVATSDIVAEELVRTLVGSIGLILSVPITTALAAIAVKGQGAPPGDEQTTGPSTEGPDDAAGAPPEAVEPKGTEPETVPAVAVEADEVGPTTTVEPPPSPAEPKKSVVIDATGRPDSGTALFAGEEPLEQWTDPDTEASIAEFLEKSRPPGLGLPQPSRRKSWYSPFRRYVAPAGVPRKIGRKERRFWREG
jgi:hypothetical protein